MTERQTNGFSSIEVASPPVRKRGRYAIPGPHPETLTFLVDVTQSKLYENLDARRRNLIGIYYGSQATLEDLVQVAQVTSRKSVRQLIISGMEELWRNLPSDLQEKHPREKVIKFKKRFDHRAKERMSKSRTFYWQDHVRRDSISERLKSINEERSPSNEARRLMSAASKRMWQNPEYRSRITEATKRMWQNPEYRDRMSRIVQNRVVSPETRAKLKEILSEIYSAPEMRVKLDEAREMARTPESRDKMSKARKSLWQDPVLREIMIEAMREGWKRKKAAVKGQYMI
ncbi:hypothetical protein HY382_02955 [Candidatus Curtissbacteria bacterium]|nr:hypothetical protein [Candidatus Curtissbacteria bacterium]